MKDRKEYYRKIPGVDVLLEQPSVRVLIEVLGKGIVTNAVRKEVEALRELIRTGTEEEMERELEAFSGNLPEKILRAGRVTPCRVLNASGILLHTNLGRAPLGNSQRQAAFEVLSGYCSLEWDRETGKRGKRREHYEDLICRVTGAEAALAVNNNAAAMLLLLGTLEKGKEVLVSRGELIEIGGKFRIPDVMEQSGMKLHEVGTTNRTRISDYERAVSPETAAILKVHTSNYKICGFTEDTSVEELSSLGKKQNIPVFADLGSGVLLDLERFGISHEPTVQEVLKKGADVVCFSGDKLLVGPQAGILAGKKEWIRKMETHPLMRALRPDKCTIALLAASFREYLDEDQAVRNIPVLRMLSRSGEELKQQADMVCSYLKEGNLQVAAEVCESRNMVGGGALPCEMLSGYAVVLSSRQMSCEMLMEKLRKLPVPVIGHVKNEKVWLEMRTIMPEETELLKRELEEAGK